MTELVDGVFYRLGRRALMPMVRAFLLSEVALRFDMVQAVLEGGAAHFDIFGQLEPQLESALGKPRWRNSRFSSQREPWRPSR